MMALALLLLLLLLLLLTVFMTVILLEASRTRRAIEQLQTTNVPIDFTRLLERHRNAQANVTTEIQGDGKGQDTLKSKDKDFENEEEQERVLSKCTLDEGREVKTTKHLNHEFAEHTCHSTTTFDCNESIEETECPCIEINNDVQEQEKDFENIEEDQGRIYSKCCPEEGREIKNTELDHEFEDEFGCIETYNDDPEFCGEVSGRKHSYTLERLMQGQFSMVQGQFSMVPIRRTIYGWDVKRDCGTTCIERDTMIQMSKEIEILVQHTSLRRQICNLIRSMNLQTPISNGDHVEATGIDLPCETVTGHTSPLHGNKEVLESSQSGNVFQTQLGARTTHIADSCHNIAGSMVAHRTQEDIPRNCTCSDGLLMAIVTNGEDGMLKCRILTTESSNQPKVLIQHGDNNVAILAESHWNINSTNKTTEERTVLPELDGDLFSSLDSGYSSIESEDSFPSIESQHESTREYYYEKYDEDEYMSKVVGNNAFTPASSMSSDDTCVLIEGQTVEDSFIAVTTFDANLTTQISFVTMGKCQLVLMQTGEENLFFAAINKDCRIEQYVLEVHPNVLSILHNDVLHRRRCIVLEILSTNRLLTRANSPKRLNHISKALQESPCTHVESDVLDDNECVMLTEKIHTSFQTIEIETGQTNVGQGYGNFCNEEASDPSVNIVFPVRATDLSRSSQHTNGKIPALMLLEPLTDFTDRIRIPLAVITTQSSKSDITGVEFWNESDVFGCSEKHDVIQAKSIEEWKQTSKSQSREEKNEQIQADLKNDRESKMKIASVRSTQTEVREMSIKVICSAYQTGGPTGIIVPVHNSNGIEMERIDESFIDNRLFANRSNSKPMEYSHISNSLADRAWDEENLPFTDLDLNERLKSDHVPKELITETIDRNEPPYKETDITIEDSAQPRPDVEKFMNSKQEVADHVQVDIPPHLMDGSNSDTCIIELSEMTQPFDSNILQTLKYEDNTSSYRQSKLKTRDLESKFSAHEYGYDLDRDTKHDLEDSGFFDYESIEMNEYGQSVSEDVSIYIENSSEKVESTEKEKSLPVENFKYMICSYKHRELNSRQILDVQHTVGFQSPFRPKQGSSEEDTRVGNKFRKSYTKQILPLSVVHSDTFSTEMNYKRKVKTRMRKIAKSRKGVRSTDQRMRDLVRRHSCFKTRQKSLHLMQNSAFWDTYNDVYTYVAHVSANRTNRVDKRSEEDLRSHSPGKNICKYKPNNIAKPLYQFGASRQVSASMSTMTNGVCRPTTKAKQLKSETISRAIVDIPSNKSNVQTEQSHEAGDGSRIDGNNLIATEQECNQPQPVFGRLQCPKSYNEMTSTKDMHERFKGIEVQAGKTEGNLTSPNDSQKRCVHSTQGMPGDYKDKSTKSTNIPNFERDNSIDLPNIQSLEQILGDSLASVPITDHRQLFEFLQVSAANFDGGGLVCQTENITQTLTKLVQYRREIRKYFVYKLSPFEIHPGTYVTNKRDIKLRLKLAK